MFCIAPLLFVACGSIESRTGNAGPPPDGSEGIVDAQDGRVAAEFIVEPDEISADGQVVLRVVNHGDAGLGYGRPITVEKWDGSEWVETDESRNAAWTMELIHLAPGETGVEQRWPFLPDHRPAAGWYRFSKIVQEEGTRDPVRLDLRARVRVR